MVSSVDSSAVVVVTSKLANAGNQCGALGVASSVEQQCLCGTSVCSNSVLWSKAHFTRLSNSALALVTSLARLSSDQPKKMSCQLLPEQALVWLELWIKEEPTRIYALL